ncbi:MAG: hypothetical protein D6718_13840 [Acidobacteria bacterium]|nr:MAG: hypothetical protein D6718_13840 [Acidobacteriota bacterium]
MKRPLLLAALALAASARCGSDFRPPPGATTGRPASPLGQTFDVTARFPAFAVPGREPGLELDLVLDLPPGAGPERTARVTYAAARLGGRPATVTDASGGRARVTIEGDLWATGRVGPVMVEGTSFEYALRGTVLDGGFRVAGESWESQTGILGSFDAWRRHRFLVAGSDFFAAGRVSLVELVRGAEIRVTGEVAPASPDAVLRRTGPAVFVVNRLSYDNLERLDPDAGFAAAWQAGVGQGANPHDVARVATAAGERLFVTRYEPPFDDVAVLQGQGGGFVASIPLGDLAGNPDGTPRPDRIALAEGKLFVGLQDIDRSFTDYAEGKLAVIDPETLAVEGVIPLGGKNPGTIEVLTGADGRTRLFVALAGIFPGLLPQELSGGVAVVDVTNRVLERFALDDDDAGGNIGALAVARDDLAYAVVSDENFINSVLAFDPASGTILRVLRETQEFVPEIEVDSGGVLAVPDRNFFDPKLCLYAVPADAAGAERLLGCGGLDLPPFSVEALD